MARGGARVRKEMSVGCVHGGASGWWRGVGLGRGGRRACELGEVGADAGGGEAFACGLWVRARDEGGWAWLCAVAECGWRPPGQGMGSVSAWRDKNSWGAEGEKRDGRGGVGQVRECGRGSLREWRLGVCVEVPAGVRGPDGRC